MKSSEYVWTLLERANFGVVNGLVRGYAVSVSQLVEFIFLGVCCCLLQLCYSGHWPSIVMTTTSGHMFPLCVFSPYVVTVGPCDVYCSQLGHDHECRPFSG